MLLEFQKIRIKGRRPLYSDVEQGKQLPAAGVYIAMRILLASVLSARFLPLLVICAIGMHYKTHCKEIKCVHLYPVQRAS